MSVESQSPPNPSERLLSLDALRGFDMLWIVGGDRLVHALASWSETDALRMLDVQFEHVEWAGFRFYDLIFPLFLFLVGAVLPFSLAKYRGAGSRAVYRRIARRTVLLFGLGLICNGILQFDWENLRIAGVLQRIAICYGLAALLVLHLGARGQATVMALILIGYWIALATIATPGGTAGDFSKEGNLAGWVDREYLPGKILEPYYGFGDNEGLLSTIPAVASTLLGALAGAWLRSDRNAWTKVRGLVGAGLVCLIVGSAWGLIFPIIKNLWTSSFVLVAGGCSLLLLALFYAVIDVLRWRTWSLIFVVVGVNAITIYVVPRFLDFDTMAQFFFGGLYRLADRIIEGDFRPVAMALGALTAKWLFFFLLYRNRLYLRV